mmetsp:Transcript_25992/g.56657  ORF Transcript_25992/g.56657 Transcript_25992/m.56657 type:complete len:161 (-) Transcript_25992:651-1133(-)
MLHSAHLRLTQPVRSRPCLFAARHNRVAFVPRANQQTGTDQRQTKADEVPIGCSRYTVSLKKPLGLVLEQKSSNGNIYVVDIKPESSAEKSGQISIGDQLIATSGVVYTKELDYAGATVKGGQEIVRLLVLGEEFKTVSAAIGSHPGHIPVTLEFQRCEK